MSMVIMQKKTGTGIPTPWELTNFAYTGNSFDTSNEDGTPRNIYITNDGLKMYMVGDSSNAIYQYTLSTAWDISSATYDSKSKGTSGVDAGVFETAPHGIDFKPDGIHMYIAGSNTDQIRDYTLSTPWDVSTATHTYGFASGGTDASGVRITNSGTKVSMFDWFTAVGYQFTLSSAYDLSTQGLDGTLSYASAPYSAPNVTGFSISPDGTKMIAFVREGAVMDAAEYTLTVPYDVTTGVYVQNADLSSQATAGSGMFVSPDGTKMYASCQNTDAIYQYSL